MFTGATRFSPRRTQVARQWFPFPDPSLLNLFLSVCTDGLAYAERRLRRSRFAFMGGAVLKQACAKVESLQNFHTWQIIVSILSVNLV